MDTTPVAPTSAPPSGFVSSEFISTLIGFVLVIWQMLAGNLDPALAGAIVAGGAAVYAICRTALKVAHANGYAKAFPDLPDISFGPGGKQAGFVTLPLLLGMVFAMAIVIGLTACAVAPKTPDQGVVLLHGDYQAAADGILAYKRLPPCSATAKVVCADPGVVTKLKSVDACAYAGLTMAEAAVRGVSVAVDVTDCGDAAAKATLARVSSLGDVAGITATAQQLIASLAALVATVAPPK